MEAINNINRFLQQAALGDEGMKQKLSACLNHLLVNDFPALVQVLYRVDVSENKLKHVLRENKNVDAGDLLAELLIARQQQKTMAAKMFPSTQKPPPDEAW